MWSFSQPPWRQRQDDKQQFYYNSFVVCVFNQQATWRDGTNLLTLSQETKLPAFTFFKAENSIPALEQLEMHLMSSAGAYGLNVLMENVVSFVKCTALLRTCLVLGMKRDGQLEVCDVNINVPSVPNGRPGQLVELRGHQRPRSYHTTSH